MHAQHSPDTQATQFELLNTRTLGEGKYDTAIVPIGSCESHGDHLPFGMDALTAHALALRVGEKVAHSLVLPPTFFGMSHHYRHQATVEKGRCMAATVVDYIAGYLNRQRGSVPGYAPQVP